MHSNYHKNFIGVFLLVILLLIAYPAYALKIIPPRLVLGPDVSLEYMFVKNNSDKPETYRFAWKHMAMDKEGKVLNLDKLGMEHAPAEYKPLSDIVRFSPRRAVLQPGQTQRVTFLIRRGQDLAAGEYRSHFLVQREPKVAPSLEENNINSTDESNEATTPSVAIDVSISRAVPIYVIHGETSASLEIIDAKVEKNAQKTKPAQPDHIATFKVRKTGNRSVIGVATILCQSGGDQVVISKPSKLFAVYAEGEFRDERMAVQLPSGGCSSYKLVIKGHNDDLLAGQMLATKQF